MKTQLAVLGGGPGGYSAAFRAADLGMEVTIVEQRGPLGGLCLHEGCIPSKALLHVGRGISRVEEMHEWGVDFQGPEIDLDALRARKDRVIKTLSDGLAGLAKRRKVKVVRARASFESSSRLRLEGDEAPEEKLEYDRLILATGSLPMIPGPLQVESDRLMTSRQALALPEVPKSLLVVGGSYVGLEMATTYARLGSKVTVVEMMDDLMPGVDADLTRPLRQALENLLEQVRVRTRVESIKKQKGKLQVTMAGEDEQETASFERVLVAVGHRPCCHEIGLDSTGVELDDDGFVVTDDGQRTADDRILAVGDVAGQPLLAHKAFREGHVAAEVAAGESASFDARAIPMVVFTDPEVAWVGVTETEARERGLKVDVARMPWAASGRAHAIGRPDGMTKLIFDPESERLLGAGIAGAEAGELISECALGIEAGARAWDIADTIHVHPTLGETVAFAAARHLGVATEVGPQRRRSDKREKG
jgi:dihydrolipoamide dehydrogenase